MFVSIESLSFKYPGSKECVLDNLDMEIAKGEVLAILGESGSGKSTILRILAGLEEPECGIIRADGQTIVSDRVFTEPEKRGMGMVFQDYALFPHMTVEQNIIFGMGKIARKEKKSRLDELIHMVRMKGYEKRYPHELSGGQQQRVALARAMAPRPKLMLLDEPFSSLDANLQSSIRADVKDILSNSGITSVFVTHDKQDALSIADRVIVVEKGRIVRNGRPRDILAV
ncbi:iron(III) transport system ATP-binding protein [Peptoclostridium litorale DSM 5388]|uniref:ABC-type quaternary amine transporter n=1 Tax=Peptoclostridium litorale DSM 5388 TaxID=1121324 RepID=A0A069RRG1_PEPLI|nr:ABC transporter ATP-binding protein [Peptoclostridium litorale]KDR96772.1 putrescine transport ATP-binding protein PotG [Peptoclostridium litorale DSM 5388]SIO34574.1 iron(III) transport system ATP-binding protein [Peptoclostridium litorale DSM 5388]